MWEQNNWTGERLETSITNEIMVEHLHRYAFALESVKGKKVLDIACGEGYGTNLLSKIAGHVTGIDNESTVIDNAKTKYNSSNLLFKTGSILQIPAESNSFDVITCFETLEHLNDHEKILTELKRVLIPGGILFISTPEKSNYSDARNFKNPFHQKEMYGQEFKELLVKFFPYQSFYKQYSRTGSFIENDENKNQLDSFSGDYADILRNIPIPAMYWIAVVSDKELPYLNGSFFQHPKEFSQVIHEETEAVKKTLTYRTGNLLLTPFKFIRSLFRK